MFSVYYNTSTWIPAKGERNYGKNIFFRLIVQKLLKSNALEAEEKL